jgi:hypothetical protein
MKKPRKSSANSKKCLTNQPQCAIIKVQKRNAKEVNTMAKKIFRTEMMDRGSYHEYMTGGYNYKVTYYDVEAETLEEAVAIAKRDNSDYFVNEYYAREVPKVEHIVTRKARLTARLAELEKSLEMVKKELAEEENRG